MTKQNEFNAAVVPHSDDDEAWEWIFERARRTFSGARRQVRGQIMMRSDSEIAHYVWAAIEWYRSRQHRTPQPQRREEGATVQYAVRGPAVCANCNGTFINKYTHKKCECSHSACHGERGQA